MKQVELLAPAKDKQTAFSAIDCGADALYIGASSFGARKSAGNSLGDIREIIDYAHKFYAKVYVTINTILTDEELEQAVVLINELYKIGADAIIIQDMGILQAAVQGKLSPIPIHASTQCDNRTLEKIKFFEETGVPRVILARELSLKEIKKISENTNIELESFVHGALCVSYSGQCYLSCSLGGRSANRGECAQPCRKKYSLMDEDGKVIAKDKYLLSLRDFNATDYVQDLIGAGVKSFKIEGRLKDENYVKNTVLHYRSLLPQSSSGKVFVNNEEYNNSSAGGLKIDPCKSFNRGFTDYFLNEQTCDGTKQKTPRYNFSTPKSIGEKLGKVTKIGQNYFEIDAAQACRTDKAESVINHQDGLCYFANDELQGCLVNKVEGKKIFPNKMGDIKVGTIVFRNSDFEFEKKLSTAKIKRKIGVEFELENGFLKAKDEDNNEIEIALPHGEEAKNPEKMKEIFVTQLEKTGESDFYVKKVRINHRSEQGETFSTIPFYPMSILNELRRNALEMLLAERLNNYKREIQNPLKYAEFPIKEPDYRANIHNEKAKEFYQNCGCEVKEMSFEQCPKKTAELMRTKHCLKFAFDMCKSPKKLFLIDEKNKRYPLQFDCKNCNMILTNCP